MAHLIDDFDNQGLAALPDALQVSELWRERLLLLDVFLLIILKILLIVADFLLLNDILLFGVHIAFLLILPPLWHLPIDVG
jgi:hypothetical protein